MKLNDCKFLALLLPLFLMACNGNAKDGNTGSGDSTAQTAFSVQKISKEEFLQAYETSKEYNAYPQEIDSVAHHKVLAKIFQNARERIAKLDSPDEYETIYRIEEDAERYSLNNLLYYPDLKMIGFMFPYDFHNFSIWWYDSTTGKPIKWPTLEPMAVNKNGIIACQVFEDCDIPLNFKFNRKYGDTIYEFLTYKDNDYTGYPAFGGPYNDPNKQIFWHKNNTLYFQTETHYPTGDKTVYLKISVNHQH